MLRLATTGRGKGNGCITSVGQGCFHVVFIKNKQIDFDGLTMWK